jgi:hypothetical protein
MYTERIVTYIPKEWKEFLDQDKDIMKDAEFYRAIIQMYLERQPDWIKRKKKISG